MSWLNGNTLSKAMLYPREAYSQWVQRSALFPSPLTANLNWKGSAEVSLALGCLLFSLASLPSPVTPQTLLRRSPHTQPFGVSCDDDAKGHPQWQMATRDFAVGQPEDWLARRHGHCKSCPHQLCLVSVRKKWAAGQSRGLGMWGLFAFLSSVRPSLPFSFTLAWLHSREVTEDDLDLLTFLPPTSILENAGITGVVFKRPQVPRLNLTKALAMTKEK